MEANTSKKSPLTLAQWSALEKASEAAQTALGELSHLLFMAAAELNQKPDTCQATFDALMTEAKKAQDARSAFLGSYFYHCTNEWIGGNSLDPKNSRLREPNFMTGQCSSRRYVDAR